MMKNNRLYQVRNKSFSSILLMLFFAGTFTLAQEPIDIHINSGDPAFPFPQFQPYINPSGKFENVGTRNNVGVPHAEMEKTIREAYRIMMNRAEKPGGGVGGIDYVYFRSSPDCSEGDGYAMLAAAAMADKPTFDGLWLWVHDHAMNKVKRYRDCEESTTEYLYSQLPGWQNVANTNSAADGDFDIALALLWAYRQWGEFMGINDACGNPISYKQAAIDFIKALTDTFLYNIEYGTNYLSGDIGFDGYFKGGDSWQELTDWATDPVRSGFGIVPESRGPQAQHIDYTAPSYFRQFADLLAEVDSARYAWNIYQFRRAEASSDWLMGQLYNQGPSTIPYAGWVSLGSDNVPVFSEYMEGEDFRLGWRTILNYMWHGNPTSTWDPVTHQVTPGVPNTFERDMALRYARFLWDNRQDPWNNPCVPGADKKFTYWGPHVLWTHWPIDGKGGGFFFLNWIHGTGSPSAVISQDFALMGDMYRQLEIEWDVDSPGDGYLTSVPFYFHGWFRLLGLLVLSGNYHAPSEIKPTANMKAYLNIDKTFAFEKDSVTYTIDYRNYGSLDAMNVAIVDTLHRDFEFLSATSGGVYNPQAHTVTWNIGTVPGFKTATGIEPTKGQVKLVVRVREATQKQYRNSVTISCSNGTGWTSNEYPNNITSVMERNYLDIAKRALIIDKTVSTPSVNPGKEVEFTINFENTSEAGWINGGRPGVHLSYASGANPLAPMNTMKVRLFHHAQEAYIDYGNYRISYFLFDPGLTCYQDSVTCPSGWGVQPTIVEGLDRDYLRILHENITPGEDERGKWNQRIVIQFSDPLDPNRVENLATIDHHLREYAGMTQRIHKGGTMPLRLAWNLHGNWTDLNWADDWSWNPKAQDDDGGVYYPITGDWTDPDNPDVPVNNWDPKSCEIAKYTVDNVLVEEWDGYTWRRVFGNGPLPGRDAINVIIRDTIPAGLTFVEFTSEPPLGVTPKIDGNVITWIVPKLQIKEKGTISYKVKAAGVCPIQDKNIMTRAWIQADKESPVSDSVAVLVTCDEVPPPPPPPTTMYKVADKSSYMEGDTVVYTIAYKQTHGSVVTDISNQADWIDRTGNGKMSIGADGTISYNKQNARMVYKYSYGVNGSIGGTIKPATYSEFSLVLRDNGSDFVEVRMKHEWGEMLISFYNNGTRVGDQQTFTYKDFPNEFNFKILLSADTISFWAGDTSALLPNVRQSGIAVRAGHAGVKSGNDAGATITGFNTNLDAGFNVSISDAVPGGLTFINAGGMINTGSHAGTQIPVSYNDGVLKWQVVSGDTCLGANDSVTVWFRALCTECRSDTIINTAYTTLLGYPDDKIAAQVRTPCIEEPDDPDHVDIVLDTTKINLRGDHLESTVTMDAGTRSIQLYAVVRDAEGNYIEKASLAVWESRNEGIVTVSDVPGVSFSTFVNKTGSGSVVVVVSQQGLKPDSITVIAEAAPPWPVISSAVMQDTDGDLVPDRIFITLNDTFHINQKLDNVLIDYRGNVYNIPAANADLQDVNLTVPFTSQSGTDPVPTGMVTIILTAEGSSRQSSKTFTDGVGPALSNAFLSENLSGDTDTLSIAFSEQISMTNLVGPNLQLIKSSTGERVTLTVLSIISGGGNQNTLVAVQSASSVRPAEGDSLRLVPGEQGGSVTDLAGNKPHLLNRPVVIRGKPAPLTGGWYVDETGDGVVDAVYLRFHRSVDINDMLFSLSWGGSQRLNSITSEYFTYSGSTSVVKVALPDSFKVGTGIKTSGAMFVLVESVAFPELWRSIEAADSAAPVIEKAAIYTGSAIDENTVAPDTLEVYFTEKVAITPLKNPFQLLQPPSTEYSLSELNQISLNQNVARFTFRTPSGTVNPKNGDSIRINPESTVSDTSGSFQNNPSNRYVKLEMNRRSVPWVVQAGPNPFNPTLGQAITIRVGASLQSPIRPEITDISIKMFDAVGNQILPDVRLSETRNGFEFRWNGRNKNNRIVATGVYLCVIKFHDGTGTQIQKVMVAVDR